MLKRIYIIAVAWAFVLTQVNQLDAQSGLPKPYGSLPTARQLQWQNMGMYGMVCFGLNTFTDQEWGYGDVTPRVFNPTNLDVDQIVIAAKAGGLKGLLLVAKHHDGFCLWPTKTTAYNISKSPWKKGKGDLVKDFADACRRHGLKFGLYCSPWDRNSAYYGTPRYIEIYREQLKELYTHYGPLFITWFDGANGGDGYYGGAKETRTIDRAQYYGWDALCALVRQLQPSANIFSDIGPDLRWVGNEKGEAGPDSRATFTPLPAEGRSKIGLGEIDYSHSASGTPSGQYWIPAECDVPLRPGWFYHKKQDDQVKTPQQLFDLYLKSVGRGAGLDLGLAPDPRGQLASADVNALTGFGKILKQTFKQNLAKGATFTASNIRGNNSKSFGPSKMLDQDNYSGWTTDDSVTMPTVTMELNGPKRFNIIRIRENIELGQRVEGFAIDAWLNNKWQQVCEAGTIGALRLIKLNGYVVTRKIRIRITAAPVCPVISDFGLFAEQGHEMSGKGLSLSANRGRPEKTN